MSASAVKVCAVLQLLWTATAAGLAVCVCFAFVLRAFENAAAAVHAKKPAAVLCYAIVTVVPTAICVGAIAAGVLASTGS